MSKKTLYLIRHCRPTLVDGQRRFIGQTDLPLSEDGVIQAKALGQFFKDKDIEAIYCSDLMRSYDTAKEIGLQNELHVQVITAFKEINLGQWEGETFAEIARCYPEAFQARGQDIGYFRPPEGESFIDLSKRVLPIFEKIIRQDNKSVVIVGHAGVNRMILCNLLNIQMKNMFKISQNYGGINIIQGKISDLRLKTLNMLLEEIRE
ncbi:alpha-ribazole phosphatase [Fusibacter sp. 3D3]|uniref:alpha-ribazole phosphatase n=1 Tax=Fusibacter sp. 3D3 TaxID=1048380 RepID=UPI000853A63E|nr:alpha-ribazole phosphatase [Fusibacter sp. 3D3]GAU77649.1 alpha-ribazole-5'-phosphate phosphatase [Fusibacter sp. 3D3]